MAESEQSAEGTDWEGRWEALDRILTRPSQMTHPEFEPTVETRTDFLQSKSRILVVGAGGLGCELLKNLALSGFGHIDVIDMDTVDVSNLNRQYLFRNGDVGQAKAIAAANFINKRVAGCHVTPYYNRIQDFGPEFYAKYNVIICGLDSVPARRWINAMAHSLVEYDEHGTPSGIVPVVDGGSEGLKGQTRVIVPGISSCFECSLSTYTHQTVYPLCTIASTPRLPEHCVEYAKLISWPKAFPETELDADNPEHLQWLFDTAKTRAAEFNIPGITYRLTQGVVKNIIPAVASTNAIIAAACSLEVLKMATNCNSLLNNYAFYNGMDGVYVHTFEYERDEDCVVCSARPRKIEATEDMTLRMLCKLLDSDLQMKQPGLRSSQSTLFMSTPESLRVQTEKNLDMTLSQLGLENGDKITVTDPAIPQPVTLVIAYQ